MSDTDSLILGSLIIGSICLFWQGKRKFNRLNQLGIEQHSSFSHKIRATIFDTLLLGCGGGLLGGAFLLFLLEYERPFVTVLVWAIQALLRKPQR
jgi:hypothetical protein